MHTQDSSSHPTLHSSSEIKKTEVIRHTANFSPSIWGDYFLAYTCDNKEPDTYDKQVEELKEEVKRLLTNSANRPLEILNLIDTLQRLGLSYHFEGERNQMLEQIFEAHISYFNDMGDDLHAVALLFRLLRQHGYNIPCDVFNKFKDERGNFKEILTRDIRGMLSLYEAAHLGIRGEDILDDVLSFTTTHLNTFVSNASSSLVKQMMHALEQPLHKGTVKLEARRFISFYEEDETRKEVILKLAKLDFNQVQLLHRKELSELSRWWKDMDFKTKTPYARDRVVELYHMWIVGIYPEPQYSVGRIILAKVIGLVSIIDDTYDAYGHFNELKLFTDAVERWDASETGKLPEYMKVIYLALLDVYNEIEQNMKKEGRSYCVSYPKEVMKTLVRAYFSEAKWLSQGCIPTVEEYLDISTISCGYPMLTLTSFVFMGEVATKEAFDFVSSTPKIVKNSSLICRLMDDIMSNEFEQKREHVCSAIECYMKQYGTSRQEAIDELRKVATNAWKEMNEELLQPALPLPLLLRPINLARVMDTYYKHGSSYTHPGKQMKDDIVSLFISPIPI
ncbi:PREDICTED: probable terpene synthase 2 [Nelumbo nucifera]|uniref:Probable terpene synthase 2 n=1 Tax=Nelumbo nucifera TaxID=4432 RepID=A0A1U8Q031_NELNU|nr:PREDICTED: probable terpene synthase 2 [Nelumbo nucifera]